MTTWDAPSWVRAVDAIGELKDVGSVEEPDLASLSISAADHPGRCFIASVGSRKVILNRFGSARRVALALGLNPRVERAGILDHWRSVARTGRLEEPPEPPAPSDPSYLVMDAPDREGWDRASWQAYPRSVMVERALELAGVPNIAGVWFPPQGQGRDVVVVAIKQAFGGHAMQSLTIAGQGADGAGNATERRFAVVVDEDIDIFNMNDVLWALMTRCDPQRDMTIIRVTPRSSQLLIDATKPWEWKDRFAETITDSNAERAAFERWSWILHPDLNDPQRAAR